MIIEKGALWAGTEASFLQATALAEKVEAKLPELLASKPSTEEPYKPYQVTKNGTAIVSVKGPMVNIDLPPLICLFLGLTSYPALQSTLSDLLEADDVKRILLDVNSGGGSVAGLNDTTELLRSVAEQKPVATYAGDNCCSAAYWLGSVGQTIGMSEAGTTGSIGVIGVHVSEKEAAEREGYKPTVMRSGSRKALGHPLEDFTDEAKAEMQRALDFAHANFVKAVAQNRNQPVAQIQLLADGRCFYGAEALDVGLVDRMCTFQEFLADFEAQAAGSYHQPSGFAANNGGHSMNLEQALARVAELEGEQEAGKTALAAAEARAATAEGKVAELTASNQALATSLAAAEADRQTCADILDRNIHAMATAMNAEVLVPEDFAGKQAYFNQIQEKFNAKFPAGGVAAVAPQSEGGVQASDLPAWARKYVK